MRHRLVLAALIVVASRACAGEAPSVWTAPARATLPFTLTATESTRVPAFIDKRVNRDFYDAAFVMVRIDGDLWVFQTRCSVEPNHTPDAHVYRRWKGTTIDDVVQQPDGRGDDALRGDGGRHWIMGLWYDAPARRLYALMHVEFAYTGSNNIDGFNWCPRRIELASSDDLGLTWHAVGDVITSEFATGPIDFYRQSGRAKNTGCGDFDFLVDERGGYFYVYWTEHECGKGALRKDRAPSAEEGSVIFTRKVARCAIADKLAPGAWRKFHDGAWDEPGIGGKSSIVATLPNPGFVDMCWNSRLGCFMALTSPGTGNGLFYGYRIALCDDLATQRWRYDALIPALRTPIGALQAVDAEGTDDRVVGDRFRVYLFYGDETSRAFDVALGDGETVAPTLAQDYPYQPSPDASDALVARRTRIVGAASPETSYAGAGWREVADARYLYGGCARASSTPGDAVRFAFTGGEVLWRAVRCPGGGVADVDVDGVARATVDLASPVLMPYQFVYRASGLDPAAPHAITVVVRSGEIRHIAFEHAAECWRASTGFSSVMGKGGWSYRGLADGPARDLVFAAVDERELRNWWRDDGEGRVGEDWLAPGAHGVARVWTAPHDGLVRIAGSVRVEPSGAAATVAITRGVGELWPAHAITVDAHALTARVAAGDEIAFTARRVADAPLERVAWDPEITYLPER